MVTKTQYYFVDIIKFLMCLCIIALHCGIHTVFDPDTQYWLEKGLFRLAVPFFFMTSGFLLGEKISKAENDTEKIKECFVKYSKRLLLLLMVFEPISILINIIKYVCTGEGILMICMRAVRSIVFYPRGALWFIQACIVAVWIVYFFYKCNSNRWIFPLSVILYSFALICNSYFFIAENSALGNCLSLFLKVTVSARNGVFVGFPYIYWGISVHRIYDHKIFKLCRSTIAWLALGLFYFLYLLELNIMKNFTLNDDGSLFIVLPFFTFLLLVLCLQFKIDTENRKIILLRNLSTGMYVLHSPVRDVIQYGTKIVFGYNINLVFLFILTTLICFSLCMMSYKSKNIFIKNLLK